MGDAPEHFVGETLRAIPSGPEREALMPLLLLADEAEAQVRSYYQEGDLYVLTDAAGAPLGMTLVLHQGDGWAELKAVAVDPARHNQGVGKRLLARTLAALRAAKVRRVVVGTGNSGIGQIAFYQKAGFRMWRIERDVFTVERGYPAGMEENGIALRDMIWFEREL